MKKKYIVEYGEEDWVGDANKFWLTVFSVFGIVLYIIS